MLKEMYAESEAMYYELQTKHMAYGVIVQDRVLKNGWFPHQLFNLFLKVILEGLLK